MKQLLCLILGFAAAFLSALPARADVPAPETSAPSVLLMDQDSGRILYARQETDRRPLASVTKVMTLLLTFEALDSGRISLDDTVTVSEHAAGMGGSQVFLEPMETQSVETLIKCIVISSANDACVAMAEHLGGTESAFVEQMNKKAGELGMKDTHFVNSCGLDAKDHYSSALDIALMSRELTTKHPEIFEYTKIWTEDMTHHTRKGDSSFTLNSTNKLLKQYPCATGLKTGSTSQAGFCLSATASKDDVHLIAVIMAAADSKARIADAIHLFDWGFGICRLLCDANTDSLSAIPVTGGTDSFLPVRYRNEFRYLDTSGSSEELSKSVDLPDSIAAPVKKGDPVGRAAYYLAGEKVGEVEIIASASVEEETFRDVLIRLLHRLFFDAGGRAAADATADGPS